ncbi:MAG TPA: hypothetical protein DCX07_09325 [Phycisphaerales bacterium]|nr:hypothetical protein [Phycisphaerales bacterium]
MRPRLVRVRRLPRVPLWAVALLAIWGTMVLAATVLSARTGRPVTLCPLKLLTGLPCPACGTTRGLLALANGDWAGPWRHNPLAFALLAGAAGLLAFRLVAGRTIRLDLSARQRIAAIVLSAALLAANWAYVILVVH